MGITASWLYDRGGTDAVLGMKMNMCMYVFVYLSVYVRMCVYACVCIRVSMCVCTCMWGGQGKGDLEWESNLTAIFGHFSGLNLWRKGSGVELCQVERPG